MAKVDDKKRKDEHVITIETNVKLGVEKKSVDLEKRRSAIAAALQAATAGLAASASGLAGRASDGGAPPWGEVIIEPIWPEKNPEFGHMLKTAAQLKFWR